MRTRTLLSMGRIALATAAVTVACGPSLSWAQSKDPRYGFFVSTDNPFYYGGDVSEVELSLFNFSALDAFGYSSVGGGLGCSFHVWIQYGEGTIAWQPGQCRDGEFFGAVLCPLIIVPINLTSGSRTVDRVQLPLVQNNPTACMAGTNGQPLPPGYYHVCGAKNFNGPNPETGFERGLDPVACTPVRVLPRP